LKSASKIGSMTIFVAACTTRSRTVGIPSGLFVPSVFGIYRRRTGCGRYRPVLRLCCISRRSVSTPRCSIIASVSPSTPAAPRFLLTRSHASERTSPSQIRPNNAWKRRVRLRLAVTYSPRWSFRTLSAGLLALSGIPSCLPPITGTTKAGPLPSVGVLVSVFFGTMSPSDSLSTRPPFAFGLWRPPLPDVGCRVGSLLFRTWLSSCALFHTPGVSCVHRFSDTVCCLRRAMIGSATPPFGSYLTRLQSSRFRIGPTTLLPLAWTHMGLSGALDAPLRRRGLSPRPEPATRRSGAYRDGTLTRKSGAAPCPPFAWGRRFRTRHA
jgi:hypothetical protein